MNVSQYEALLKAIETGTLSQAAEELGYSQSGLTRALNALEEQFGFRILIRDRSGVRLTAEGQLLLPHIRTVLYDQYRLEECVNEINGLKSGSSNIRRMRKWIRNSCIGILWSASSPRKTPMQNSPVFLCASCRIFPTLHSMRE